MNLIELIEKKDFGSDFQNQIAEIIKASIESTEWNIIESENGNVSHNDSEIQLSERYFLNWSATSYWYLSANTAKYDEEDDSSWNLTGIVFDEFSIYDWDTLETVCFFDNL